MKILICDDESIFASRLRQTISSIVVDMEGNVEIIVYRSPNKLLEESIKFDLLFLDIEMSELDGISVAKILREKNEEGKIVFVTSHQELVREGYKVQAFRYLYKPYEEREIREILMVMKEELEDIKGITMEVGEKRKCTKEFFLYKDIIALESIGNGVVIYTGKAYEIVYEKFYQIVGQLDQRFIKVHRNYCVNMEKIQYIDYDSKIIIMNNGQKFSVSKRCKGNLRQKYHTHLKSSQRGSLHEG